MTGASRDSKGHRFRRRAICSDPMREKAAVRKIERGERQKRAAAKAERNAASTRTRMSNVAAGQDMSVLAQSFGRAMLEAGAPGAKVVHVQRRLQLHFTTQPAMRKAVGWGLSRRNTGASDKPMLDELIVLSDGSLYSYRRWHGPKNPHVRSARAIGEELAAWGYNPTGFSQALQKLARRHDVAWSPSKGA